MSNKGNRSTGLAALVLAAAGGLTVSAVATAQQEDEGSRWDQLDPETQAELLAEWEAKSPEEQEAFKRRVENRRDRYQSLSEEEQAEVRARRGEKREQWAGMSEEEKEAQRAQMQERRDRYRETTPEQRQEARKRKLQEAGAEATPEEREAAMERWRERQEGKDQSDDPPSR